MFSLFFVIIVFLKERGRGNEFKHEYHDLVMQWISQFKSIGTEFPHSIATQTGIIDLISIDINLICQHCLVSVRFTFLR